MFHEQLLSLLQINQLTLSQASIHFFESYFFLTQKWNAKINLTRNISETDFMIENILDPLLSCQAFFQSCESNNLTVPSSDILDVGCGGGYVGFGWLCFLDSPDIKLTSLDADRRKINFCKQVSRENHLTTTSARNMRFEDYTQEMDANRLLLVSRATVDFDTLYTTFINKLNRDSYIVYLASQHHTANTSNTSHVPYSVKTPHLTINRKIVFSKCF